MCRTSGLRKITCRPMLKNVQVILFTRENNIDFSVCVNGNVLNAEPCVKLLGMLIDENLQLIHMYQTYVKDLLAS